MLDVSFPFGQERREINQCYLTLECVSRKDDHVGLALRGHNYRPAGRASLLRQRQWLALKFGERAKIFGNAEIHREFQPA
jgi:hypothetical protein